MSVNIQLDKRFSQKLKGRFGKYEFQVGVLEDKNYFKAKRGVRGLKGQDVLTTLVGGPARQATRQSSGKTVAQISKELIDRMGVNFYVKPFSKKTDDAVKMLKEFFKLAFGGTEKRRLENLLQAIVRNPIIRKEYGSNSALTQKIKGFNRKLIDTGQLFNSITARVRVKNV